MVFPHETIHFVSQPYHDVAQDPVVHIHATLPDNLPAVNLKLISLLDMVIQQSGQKIVGRGNRMKISRKVKIQLLHGYHLCISAACCPALDAKTGSQRRLPQGNDCLFSKPAESLPQAYACRRLPFSCRSRIDRRHQNQLSVRFFLNLFQIFIGNLRLIPAVQFQGVFRNPQLFSHLGDGFHHSFLSNFQICLHGFSPFLSVFDSPKIRPLPRAIVQTVPDSSEFSWV